MNVNNNAVLAGLNANKFARLTHVLQSSPLCTWWHAGACNVLNNNTWNPASVWFAPNGNLQIEIAEWFYRNYSAGYICGMFCHEIAVHPMADQFFTNPVVNPAGHNVNVVQALSAGPINHANSEENIIATAGAGGLIQCAALGAAGLNWQFRPSAAGQHDHIFAACEGYARYEMYQTLMLEFARLINTEINGANPHGFAQVDLDDLLDCYLMDIASIQATHDRRARGVVLGGYVAQAYNAHRARLQAGVGGLGLVNPLLARVAAIPQKTSGAVFNAYWRMLVSAFR